MKYCDFCRMYTGYTRYDATDRFQWLKSCKTVHFLKCLECDEVSGCDVVFN